MKEGWGGCAIPPKPPVYYENEAQLETGGLGGAARPTQLLILWGEQRDSNP